MKKRLFRSRKDKMLGGVCGGVAEYFQIDPTIVRVLVVLLALSSVKVFLLAYIIAAIVIPEMPSDYDGQEDDVEVMDKDGKTVGVSKDSRQVLGILFVGAGGLMLLSRTVSWFDSDILLAIAVIFIGVFVVFQGKRQP